MPNRAFWEVLRDAMVSLGVTAAFQKFVERWGQHAQDQFKERFLDPSCGRAEILEDIRIMTENPSQPWGGKPENLIYRHGQAIVNRTENRFIALLTKIPKDQQLGRRLTLKYLDGLSDKEFIQALCLLDHDVALQFFERLRRRHRRITQHAFDPLLDFFAQGADKVRDAINDATSSLNASGDWFEEREKARQNPRRFGIKKVNPPDAPYTFFHFVKGGSL